MAEAELRVVQRGPGFNQVRGAGLAEGVRTASRPFRRNPLHPTPASLDRRVDSGPLTEAADDAVVAHQRLEDPLQKEMVTHSSILAWKIPWTEKPGGLQSMGSQRVEHN